MAQNPRVGVAALILRNDGHQLTLLMGCRKESHGASEFLPVANQSQYFLPLTRKAQDTWAPPGGHLEHGESYFACAERETLEETGLRVHAKKLVAVTNDLIPVLEIVKHYVTLYVLCEPEDPVAEPEVSRSKSTLWQRCQPDRN